MIAIVDSDGWLYTVGEDKGEYGVLGVEGCYSLKEPIRLGVRGVAQVSVSDYHGAAVDKDGGLFCWGTGKFGELGTSEYESIRNPVEFVETAKMFSVKQVCCGNHVTAICTNGGYVYLYGILQSHIKPNKDNSEYLL